MDAINRIEGKKEMTKVTDTHQAARLYKSMVKEGWAVKLSLTDWECQTYIATIYDESGRRIETHELEMTDEAADVWLSGGIEE